MGDTYKEAQKRLLGDLNEEANGFLEKLAKKRSQATIKAHSDTEGLCLNPIELWSYYQILHNRHECLFKEMFSKNKEGDEEYHRYLVSISEEKAALLNLIVEIFRLSNEKSE